MQLVWIYQMTSLYHVTFISWFKCSIGSLLNILSCAIYENFYGESNEQKYKTMLAAEVMPM